jgi:hypothetical protein
MGHGISKIRIPNSELRKRESLGSGIVHGNRLAFLILNSEF